MKIVVEWIMLLLLVYFWVVSVMVLFNRFISDKSSKYCSFGEVLSIFYLFCLFFFSFFGSHIQDFKPYVNSNQERNRCPSEKRIEKIETKDLPFIQVKYCDNNWWCIIKKEKNYKEKN